MKRPVPRQRAPLGGDSWQQVKRLLDRALDRPGAERRGFLNRACGGDKLLRRQVESLLEAGEESTDFLGRPIFSLRGAGEPCSAEGRRIGRYRLGRLLGRSGMGTVYLAQRVDRDYDRRFAIKLVKRGMDIDEIAGRFRAEHKILARIEHPNVVRLLDGGTESGLPFLVMEYVAGQPIDAHCDARKLSTRERWKLFRWVCAAVHFANRHQVIHRDLKPANDLVTAAGTAKLLDFGIAKLLDVPPRSTATSESPGSGPMTPAYASPEQVAGGPITAATDVYGLGVLLFELVTGHRPYRLDTLGPRQVARVICEQPPPKPSAAILRRVKFRARDGREISLTPESVSRVRDGDPQTLRRRLASGLDAIVLRAIHKQPERRFSSVAQLSDDLGRHLAGVPLRGTNFASGVPFDSSTRVSQMLSIEPNQSDTAGAGRDRHLSPKLLDRERRHHEDQNQHSIRFAYLGPLSQQLVTHPTPWHA